jgi:uncharacterized protein YjcR
MPRNPLKVRCKAKSRTTGKQCRRWAVKGYSVCYYHGANPKNHGGAPKHNRNAMKHGAYINRLLNEEEETIFQKYYDDLQEDFELDNPADCELAKQACFCYIRLHRALKGGSVEDIYKIDGQYKKRLDILKVIKERREREPMKKTPDEWAADLLEKVRLIKERNKALDMKNK